MAQCRAALRPDGLFLAALLGGETLQAGAAQGPAWPVNAHCTTPVTPTAAHDAIPEMGSPKWHTVWLTCTCEAKPVCIVLCRAVPCCVYPLHHRSFA